MPAVTFTKTDTNGYENTRYAVSFMGEHIGDVFSFNHTEVVCTGGRRYGDAVHSQRWEFELLEGRTPQQHALSRTRIDAITDLLMVNHYPGRQHVARRLVAAGRTARTA